MWIKSFFTEIRDANFHHSLFFKTFFKLLILIFIITSSLVYVVYYNAAKILNNEMIQSNYLYTQRISDLSDSLFREIENVAVHISLDRYVQFYLYADQPKELLGDSYTRIADKISSFPLVYKYINSVYIYSEAKDTIFTNEGELPMSEFTDTNWINAYWNETDENFVVCARKKNGVYPSVITFIQKMNVYNMKGAVIVNISSDMLRESFDSVNFENQESFITDPSDTIIYSRNPDLIYEKTTAYPILDTLLSKTQNTAKPIKVQGQKYAINSIKSQYYSWDYTTISKAGEYSKKLSSTIRILAILMIGLSMIGFIISWFIAKNTYKPIKSILNVIDMPYINNNDNSVKDEEINYIVTKIITMVQTNSEMEAELKKRLSMLTKSQIASLQAQINPHFLFNTLNLINLMIVKDCGVNHAGSKMIMKLAKLLRHSIETSESLISMEKEVENSKLYVEILQNRFKDLFEVTWDIEEEIKHVSVIKLFLQPLIENTVDHGFAGMEKGGQIKISGMQVNDSVIIKIYDNGVGISQDDLEVLRCEINKEISDADCKHVGLRNVNQRLKLIFGEEYGLIIDSVKGMGTTITVTFPIIK